MKSKRPEDVRGVRISCPNYEMCPLCYGCRAFNSKFVKCQTCKLENEKQNICNTEKHQSYLLDGFIKKEIINLDGILGKDSEGEKK